MVAAVGIKDVVTILAVLAPLLGVARLIELVVTKKFGARGERIKQAIDARADQRAEEAQELEATRFYREDGEKLRARIDQLERDFDNERTRLQQQITELQATNRDQAGEILSLKGQIFDLQRDRSRQTTEGQRQTDEGIRQTREGERQTIEGQRLDKRRTDMDDEENG